MKWHRTEGNYWAEHPVEDGTVKVRCINMHGIEGLKWVWTVEWPGGQTAKGQADTYGICKELAERAAESFEPGRSEPRPWPAEAAPSQAVPRWSSTTSVGSTCRLFV